MKKGKVGYDLLLLGFDNEQKQKEILFKWLRSTILLDLDGDALTAKVIKYGTHEIELNKKNLISDEDRYKEFLEYAKNDKSRTTKIYN